MPNQTSNNETLFVRALRRTTATFFQGLEYRFDLFSIELQEEKHRLFLLLCLAIAASMAVFMAFLGLNFVILVAFGEEHRLPVAIGLVAFYLLVAIVIGLMVRRKLVSVTNPFEATLEELRKDRAAMVGEDS